MMLIRSQTLTLSPPPTSPTPSKSTTLPKISTHTTCILPACVTNSNSTSAKSKTLVITHNAKADSALIHCTNCGVRHDMFVTGNPSPKRVLTWFREWCAVVLELKDDLIEEGLVLGLDEK